MYFVHPQIKFSFKNLKKVIFSFLLNCDETALKNLESVFSGKELIFTDMGRSAFRLLVEKFQLQNSKMLFPAYICDVFYPIFKQYHISPIFIDADKNTFNISIEEISRKITPEIKSILISHTYGLPADIAEIRRLVGKDVILIEDCAHAFDKKPSQFSDAAFYSLYKSFPCARGGLVLNQTKDKLPQTGFNLRDLISLLNSFSFFAYIFKRFGSDIAPLIPRKEKSTESSQLNRVSLNLFLNFLDNFQKTLPLRLELALLFQEELKRLGFEVQKYQANNFTYLSALVPKGINRDKLVKDLKRCNIFCTRIWHTPIVLNNEVQKEYSPNPADFPNTLDIAKRVVNFPLQNFYAEKDVRKIIWVLTRIIKE